MARKPTGSLPDVFARPGRAPSNGTPIEDLPREPTVPAPSGAGAAEADIPPADARVSPAVVNPQITDVVVHSAVVNPQITDVVLEQPLEPRPPGPPRRPGPSRAEAAGGRQVASEVPAPVPAEPWAVPNTPPVHADVPHATAPLRPTPREETAGGVASASASPTSPSPPFLGPASDPGPARHASQPPPAVSPAARGPAWAIAMVALAVSLTTPFWHDSALRLFGITTAVGRAQQDDRMAIIRQEQTLRDVERRLGSANTQLAQVRTSLTEALRQQEATAAWTRLMILVRLNQVLRRSAPFERELAMVRSAGSPDGDLLALVDRLASYAPIGVPTNVELASDFRRVTDPVLRPTRGFQPAAWAATLIAWTPFARAAPEPDPDRRALQEAAVHVRDGRIVDAVALVRSTSGPIATLMAGWLADTEARSTADELGRRVEELLLRSRR